MIAPALLSLLLAPPGAVDVTVPRMEEAILVDGALDEAAWAAALVLEDFVASRPIEGRAPTQTTRVRLLRDDSRLYVAFEAADADPAGIRAKLSDRDSIFNDDMVAMVLDPFQDQRRAFIVLANPLGAQADCVHVEGAFGDDCTWDMVFSSAGRVGTAGYVVELSIPFSNIRFDPQRDAWGFQLVRIIPRTSEQVTIPERRASLGSPLKQMGVMRGMRGIRAGASLALIPEITVRAGPDARAGTHLGERGTPRKGSAGSGDAGVTAKLSRANVALDAALNPDFSQVESDAARISFNERFALYYGEKRPFFLEGRELFVTPWEVVYTRSVVDPLYGLKLSGKSGPSAYVILHALDEAPAASTLDPRWTPDAYRGEPALTTIARIATDVAPNATLGMLMTDKHVGPAWNRVAGLDGSWSPVSQLRFAGQVLASATDHPDGEYESGDVAKLRLFRTGRHFNWFSWYEQLSTGFRAEAGFIPRAGYREAGMQPSYRIESGRETGLQAIEIEVGGSALNDIEGSGRERSSSASVGFSFSSAYLESGVSYGAERFRDERFEKRVVHQEASATPVKWLSISASVRGGDAIAYFEDDPYLGGSARVTGGLGLRPSKRLSFEMSAVRSIFSADDAGDAFRQLGDRSGENVVFDATLGRLSSQLFFTQSISLRVIADWDGVSDTAAPSVLLAWRPGPGTVVYAGWLDAWATDGSEDTRPGRAAFLKLSYLFGSAS